MKQKLLVANVSDIDRRGSRKLKVGDVDIAIFRMTDGSILAVENKCPHKGGQLSEGMVCGTAVHCPLHDWKIDLRNGRVHEPDEGCVKTFPTEIDEQNGAIYVTV
ncbi:nitrite reductase (NAD(P)H) small subunit [Paenibacillus sp. 1011MAR3C5]|uniref:nitrite reductase small subunit NirD n=1 Tax=Paenibacillus sp. 1011MAR3C5 TaxID=1675787 RepID=UPI000E6CACDB|nr:nitrite reductase small subunit NirD [Paenibacillus sp. 1011MAR3C5]RJE88667.1 nitrite reductase (NAD(P)H) small subunit [Paenibacillus sp. 1011MAR3C5]